MDYIFIGYAHNSNAYWFLVHKSEISDIHEKTVIESRYASFFENIFPHKEKQGSKRTRKERNNDKNSETKTNVDISINDISENEEKDEPRRSKRARKE